MHTGRKCTPGVRNSKDEETEAEGKLVRLSSRHVPQCGSVVSYEITQNAVAATRKNRILSKFNRDE